VYDGHDGGEGVLAAVFLKLVEVQGQGSFGVVRVGAQLQGTLPGFLNQTADSGQTAAGNAWGLQAERAAVVRIKVVVARQGKALPGSTNCRINRFPH
jgi:hypothetical protein